MQSWERNLGAGIQWRIKELGRLQCGGGWRGGLTAQGSESAGERCDSVLAELAELAGPPMGGNAAVGFGTSELVP